MADPTGGVSPLFATDPYTMLMMLGGTSQDPQMQEQIAHYLALHGQHPPATAQATQQQQAQQQPATQPPGTTITPPGQTVPQQTPQMRTPGDAGAKASPLATGVAGVRIPNSSAITGADAGSNQPTQPLSFAGSQPYNFTNYPYAGASPKDTSIDAQGVEGGTSQVGAADTGNELSKSDATDTSADSPKAKQPDLATRIAKGMAGLGAVQPPASQDWRMANAPLPSHESRFTPQDLLQMISILGQSGAKTQPQSLGALIGR